MNYIRTYPVSKQAKLVKENARAYRCYFCKMMAFVQQDYCHNNTFRVGLPSTSAVVYMRRLFRTSSGIRMIGLDKYKVPTRFP